MPRCRRCGQARSDALADLRLATTFRKRGMLAPCEASQSTFVPLVVESALEEGHVPAFKLEIEIGDVVLR